MKKIIIGSFIGFVLALLAPQIAHAQGTMTVLSNLDQTSAGSLAVGSNSWFAAAFRTGGDTGGYVLNSIQLEMTGASGNPSGFTATLYHCYFGTPYILGSSLGTLDGSLNPVAGGIFTYTPASSLTLTRFTPYAIVLTAGTAVANGAYDWSYASGDSYHPSGGWVNLGSLTSSDGSFWNFALGGYPQYAINVTDVPEPGVLGLFGLGGLCFFWYRRKAKLERQSMSHSLSEP